MSGIAAYTYCLAGGLAAEVDLRVLLIRRLVPRRLYPGATRVGDAISDLRLPPGVPAHDGIDWYWGPSLLTTLAFLRRHRSDLVVLQWWTATVLHTYLLLVFVAKLQGSRVVIEFHESLDPGEQSLPALAHYTRVMAPRLFRRADAYVVHSEHDRAALALRYGLAPHATFVIPHALYEHARSGASMREAPAGVCNLLFFGLIRPVKGLDVLLAAVESMTEEEGSRYWLTIVGETWEGCEDLVEKARTGPFSDRTTVVNRYVTDAEADAWLGGADAIVLPYRASSQSGVFHMAMAYGLPAVVSDVGGLAETAATYPRAITVPCGDPQALLDGIRQLPTVAATPVTARHGWSDSAKALRRLASALATSLPDSEPAGIEGVA